ncbi:MAG: alpha-amylase family glycosyl hydrolase, partial [Polyangiaceae bacterium]
WKRPGRFLDSERADGWRVTSYVPPPGEETYAIVEDGVWLTDPNVGTTAYVDGASVGKGTGETLPLQEVTWVDVADCSHPEVRIDDAAGSADGTATVHATFLRSSSASLLDPLSVHVVDEQGNAVSPSGSAEPNDGSITMHFKGLAQGKHRLVVTANDANGKTSEPTNLTIWVEPKPFDWRDAVIYQVMVDRYRNIAGPLADPETPSSRAGGTIAGLTQSLDAIASLGFNTIWVSPLYQNPDGTYLGADGRQYSSYHGYWPTDSRAIESKLGTEADVDALIAAAHARSIRVLFDVVPNHVHQDHPYVKAHLNDGWFNNPDGKCICGTTCDWATHIQDCWFASYLPDLDWRNPAVADQGSSDVSWWLDRFDADGVRIDAVPMIPRAANRRIAYDLRAKYDHPGNETFLLGENYVDPSGYDLLRYDLGPFGLSSEFHFPLMWALRDAVATETAPMTEIETAIENGETAWMGSGAIMSLMIGNHDVPRFSTVANGDVSGDSWSAAPQPSALLTYEKQRLALGVIYTLPGAPTVYYGDEVGLAGRGDPDSRRVMPADGALSDQQKATRDFVVKLAKARACSEALRRGTYRTLFADSENLVYERKADSGAAAIVTISRAPVSTTLAVPLPGISSGDYSDLLDGSTASLKAELTNIPTTPFSVHVYVPRGGACAAGN